MITPPQSEKILLRDLLFSLLDATPFSLEAWDTKLATCTEAQVDGVIGDILADMRRGPWRDNLRWLSRPSGGSAKFYESFPQAALMHLLQKASREAAVAALTADLSSWKGVGPRQVIQRLIHYRTLADVNALLEAFPEVVTVPLCMVLKVAIPHLGKDGLEKWWRVFNKSPVNQNTVLAPVKDLLFHDKSYVESYRSQLDEFLAQHHRDGAVPFGVLDNVHLALLLEWAVVDYTHCPCPRVRIFIMSIIGLKRFAFYLGESFACSLYDPKDLGEQFVHLLPTLWSLQPLYLTLMQQKAPPEHWALLLQKITSDDRKTLLTPLATNKDLVIKYTPKELSHLMAAWSGRDKTLLTHVATQVFTALAMLEPPVDSAEAAQAILDVTRNHSNWGVFADYWQAAFPELIPSSGLVRFSKAPPSEKEIPMSNFSDLNP